MTIGRNATPPVTPRTFDFVSWGNPTVAAVVAGCRATQAPLPLLGTFERNAPANWDTVVSSLTWRGGGLGADLKPRRRGWHHDPRGGDVLLRALGQPRRAHRSTSAAGRASPGAHALSSRRPAREDDVGRRTLGDGPRRSRIRRETDGNIYLAMSLRNVGADRRVAELASRRWTPPRRSSLPDRDQFHRQGRDRSVPPGGTSFWQGALRDQDDETYRTIHDAIVSGDSVTIHLLYSDHEGGQRAVTRFSLTRCDDSEWISSVIRHWNLDRDEPR